MHGEGQSAPHHTKTSATMATSTATATASRRGARRRRAPDSEMASPLTGSTLCLPASRFSAADHAAWDPTLRPWRHRDSGHLAVARQVAVGHEAVRVGVETEVLSVVSRILGFGLPLPAQMRAWHTGYLYSLVRVNFTST